jgi:arylformamidase
MKFYDISWPISEQMTAYKDKKTVTFESVKTFQLDAVRESKITIGAHSGTHIDAPSHFIKDGATIDAVDLTAVIGPCKVFDLSTVADCIRAEDIENLSIEAGDRVLFKTANSALAPTQSFASNFIYLSSEAAQMLVQ